MINRVSMLFKKKMTQTLRTSGQYASAYSENSKVEWISIYLLFYQSNTRDSILYVIRTADKDLKSFDLPKFLNIT